MRDRKVVVKLVNDYFRNINPSLEVGALGIHQSVDGLAAV